ncbi:hypothetical protein [Streptomyces sp. ST2-7A]|uniref:hypothetical protein n=1 Tax=Streptomyces sp. ST2-7A TaxID=2907214 RepID=UPI001F3FBC8E|nr:hypothetical protein [Streptomyces sp. ST2-7A]MCE7081590.1 hypothetical protein [Streptomyces sp. ST2-7A]
MSAWPHGAVARLLTVGGASVDIVQYADGRLVAVCTGACCPWEKATGVRLPDGTVDVASGLPVLIPAAQEHAANCRLMRRC